MKAALTQLGRDRLAFDAWKQGSIRVEPKRILWCLEMDEARRKYQFDKWIQAASLLPDAHPNYKLVG